MKEISSVMDNVARRVPSWLQEESAAIMRKRERETKTVSQMIAIYCAGNHAETDRCEHASCGDPVCAECKALDDYACLKTQRCRRMGEKVSCEVCPYHCYTAQMREKIRQVMRYAGPRMLTKHPISAIRHLTGKLGAKKAAKTRA